VHTRYVIPVELNAYLCRNARVLSEFYREIAGDESKADAYQLKQDEFAEAIDK